MNDPFRDRVARLVAVASDDDGIESAPDWLATHTVGGEWADLAAGMVADATDPAAYVAKLAAEAAASISIANDLAAAAAEAAAWADSSARFAAHAAAALAAQIAAADE